MASRKARLLAASLQFRRLQLVVGLAVLVGLVTGLGVAGVHAVIVDVAWDHIERNAGWIVALPFGALVASTLILEFTRERSTDTTEEYVRVFHEPAGRVRLRSVPFRLAASIATIGLGGSMGLEGPSIYLGSSVGDLAERRIKMIEPADRKVLLVAGAAAGIAAIFKAPVTGVIFALEVPYRDDLARRALIPSIFASASAYVVFVALAGTRPLFPLTAARLSLGHLGGSVLIGAGCGLGARVFVRLHREATARLRRIGFAWRPLISGAVLAAIGAVSLPLFHRPLAFGPGYDAIGLAAAGHLGVGLLLALFGLKLVATTSTGAGNGVGGLFFPSVLMGAALGAALGHVVPGPASLFAVVGIAAFLSGSYNVPLAAVAFVAEATGAPGYIVPGLVAAALAYLVSGPASLSHRQRSRRFIDVDTRLDVAVDQLMSRDWIEVAPQCSLRDFATEHAIRAKSRTVPVVDAGRYVGMISLRSLGEVPVEEWPSTTVARLMRTDAPVLHPETKLRDAVRAMHMADIDRAAVVSGDAVVGTLQASEVLRIEEVLDEVGEEERRGLEP